ncbi:MAG: hypothetical protein ACLRIS_17995 [Flavonifractor plautii]
MTYDLLMLMFDDPHAEEVERYLTSKQIKVVREHTVKKAIQCIRYNSYHFVLLDQRLEGADFLMDIVYQGYYGIYTYLIAAGEFRHAEERAAVLRSGADVCICAPVSMSSTSRSVQSPADSTGRCGIHWPDHHRCRF